MEAQDTTELMEQKSHGDKNQNRSALTISILAMVLAIASLGGSNAMKEATQENILAANAYAFYQAKNIRQTSFKLAAADLELQLAREPNMNPAAKALFEKKLEEQEKKFEEQLKKKVDELSHLSEINNNITVTENSNNNNITNNTTNINIYSTGKEDLSILAKEDILKLCTSGTYYPLVAAEILHCNKKYPEFQNVLISNLRATTGQVKINDEWVTKSQDDILNTMMRVDKKHISSLMKNLEVDKKLQIKLESTQDEIDTNESKEHHKSKIKQKLYDASKMITKTKKQSENSPKTNSSLHLS
jgi:hypothetical protein